MTLIAAHFLAGSLLTMLLPIGLVVAVVFYFYFFVLRRHGGGMR